MTTQSPITDEIYKKARAAWYAFGPSAEQVGLRAALEAAAPLLLAPVEGEVERLKAKLLAEEAAYAELGDAYGARIDALIAPPSEEEISAAWHTFETFGQYPAMRAVLSQFLSNRTKGGEAVPTAVTEAQKTDARALFDELAKHASPPLSDAAWLELADTGTVFMQYTEDGSRHVPQSEVFAQPSVADAGGEGRKVGPNGVTHFSHTKMPPYHFQGERAASPPPPSPVAGGGEGHDSDCATHNMPALPNGPCDCSLSPMRRPLQRARDLFWEIRGDWTDPKSQCNEGAAILDGLLKTLPSPPVAMPEWGKLTDRQRAAILAAFLAVTGSKQLWGDEKDGYEAIRRALTGEKS